jgi:dephospho-CoA kinase
MRRNQIDRTDAERRVAAQMSSEEKLRYADYSIDTSGTFESTRKRVLEVFDELVKLKTSVR